MRIVVWNCDGNLRDKKFKALESLEPDVAVVPCSECPEKLWDAQPLLAPASTAWIGDGDDSGLAVFGFGDYRVARYALARQGSRWLLPVEVFGPLSFRLLAVWAVEQRLPMAIGGEVGGPPLELAQRYQSFLSVGQAIVAGTFNNNVRWDVECKPTNHANTVAALAQLGMSSAYHWSRGEHHGKETRPTYIEPCDKLTSRGVHIDYCFVPFDWSEVIAEVELADVRRWATYETSCHVPLIVDIDVPTKTTALKHKPIRTDL